MSGHSKWSKIKRQKAAGDLKKGGLFTKLTQAIAIATREGGSGDQDTNFMLRIAIEKAKEADMPKDNIERAIKKGLGEGEGGPLDSVTYELVGKGGIAVLVDCVTDNKNRTVSDVRNVALKRGFEIGSGSLGWQFEPKGTIILEPLRKEKVIIKGRETAGFKKLNKENLMLEIMEIDGVEDVSECKGEDDVESICIITPKAKLKGICKFLEEEKKLKITKAGIEQKAKNKLTLGQDETRMIKEFIEEVSEVPEVTAIWTNVDLQEPY